MWKDTSMYMDLKKFAIITVWIRLTLFFYFLGMSVIMGKKQTYFQ